MATLISTLPVITDDKDMVESAANPNRNAQQLPVTSVRYSVSPIKLPNAYSDGVASGLESTGFYTGERYASHIRTYGSTYIWPSQSAIVEGTNYGNLFFDRVHMFPGNPDLGVILSDVSNSFQVMNAHRSQHDTLDSIELAGAGFEGTVVTAKLNGEEVDVFLPRLFNALQSYGFDYVVRGVGENTIDFTITATAGSGIVPAFSVTGSRTVMFPFLPQKGVTENIEFLSNVLRAKDGSETRTSERTDPRQEFGMKYLIDQEEPQMFQNAQAILIGMSGLPLGVGLWHQARKITQDITVGEARIDVDTSDIDFRVGDSAAVWRAWNDVETVTVLTVESDHITTVSPIEGAGTTVNTYVLPIQMCVAKDNVSFGRWRNNVAVWDVKWESQQTTLSIADHTPAYPNTYQGEPLLDDHHLMTGQLKESLRSDMNIDDGKTGIRTYTVTKNIVPTTRKQWDVQTMADTMALRKFFYWARGMQKSFWYPSNRSDLTALPDTLIGAGENTMQLTDTGYAARITTEAPYNHIRITLNDGTELLREVLEAVNLPNIQQDTITLDQTFGVEIPPNTIAQICFLFHARMGQDTAQLTHSGQGRMMTSQALVGVKQ